MALGPSIYERLRRNIRQQIRKKFGLAVRKYQLVVLGGNGLTRLVAYETGQYPLTWDMWVRESLKVAGSPLGLDYLLRQGWDYPAIFDYAVRLCEKDRNKIADVFRPLWNAATQFELAELKRTKERSLHRELVKLSKAIITTNYDRLFEVALFREAGDFSSDNVFVPKYLRGSCGYNGGPTQKPRIHKIHGTLLLPKNGQEIEDVLTSEAYKKWIEDSCHLFTIAEAEKYKQAAYEMDSVDFRKQHSDVYDLLEGPHDYLVAVLGLGFGSEELVLSRLFQTLTKQPKVLMLWFGTKLQEEAKLVRPGFTDIFINLGLAASSARRFIATIAFLQEILEFINAEQEQDTLEDILHDAVEGSPALWPEMKRATDLQPLILAMGQVSMNRVIGVEHSPSQERAYSPAFASRFPKEEQELQAHPQLKPPALVVQREIGGQATVPCVLWDKLGLPSGLIGVIRDDDTADEIIRCLARSEFLEFDTLVQIPISREREQEAATESATVLTWFGLRSIFEGPRSIKEAYKLIAADSDLMADITERMKNAKLLYLTKVGWTEWRTWLEQNRVPLIIYDSGLIPEFGAEEEVAKHGGVIVASALAAVGQQHRADSIAVAWNKDFWKDRLGKVSDKYRTDFRTWWDAYQPTDDRGRLFQIKKLLECIRERSRNLIPSFLEGSLAKARAYAISLGDFGLLYWLKTQGGWSGPSRLFATLDHGEWRSAFGAGDTLRAGIAAAVVALAKASGTEPKDLTVEEFPKAFAAGVWFGTTKVRFLSIDDYIAAIGSCRNDLFQQISEFKWGWQEVNLGASDLQLTIMHVVDAQEAITQLGKELDRLIPPDEKDAAAIMEKAQSEWREERGMSKP